MEPMNGFDLFLPPVMARRAEDIGVRKANTPTVKLLMLSMLSGAFISLGAIFCTVVLAGSADMPYGIARVSAGVVFSLGLILVILGGAELFTGNNLIVMAWASGKVKTRAVLKNWVYVYLGNFIGSILTALLMVIAKQYTFGGGLVGQTALNIATAKVGLGFFQAIALGTLCNGLVCLAVWLTYSGRSATDKILSIIFPISAFVAAGFEHSVANMYFIPYGLFIKIFDPAFVAALGDKVNLGRLTWTSFFINNLLPVTIGNILGGAVLVGAVYWLVYLADAKSSQTAEQTKKQTPIPGANKTI